MSRVISVRDIQEMVRNGQGVSIPDDALVTPAARDYLNDLQTNGDLKTGSAKGNSGSTKAATNGAPLTPPTKKLSSKSPKAELEAFFDSPYAHHLKEQICEMG